MSEHPGQIHDGTGCPNCASELWDGDEGYCDWCGYSEDLNDDEEDA